MKLPSLEDIVNKVKSKKRPRTSLSISDYLCNGRVGLATLTAIATMGIANIAYAVKDWDVTFMGQTDLGGGNYRNEYLIDNNSDEGFNSDIHQVSITRIDNPSTGAGGEGFNYDWTFSSSSTSATYNSDGNDPIYSSGGEGNFYYDTTNSALPETTFKAKTFEGDDFPEIILHPSTKELVVTSTHGTPNPSGTNDYANGSNLVCTVNESVTNGLTNYVCQGWTGTGSVPASGTSNQTSFAITEDSSLAWDKWQTNYWLNTSSQAGGSVDTPDGWKEKGSNVVITSTAAPGYRATGYTGDVVTNTPIITLNMDSPKSVTATFKKKPTGTIFKFR